MSVPLNRFTRYSRWALLLGMLPLSTCTPKMNLLDRVVAAGRLTVATVNGPTTCYEGEGGTLGYECDLLQGLARHLDVKLDLRYFSNTPAVVDAVQQGRADLGAAGIAVTPDWSQRVRFTRPLTTVVQQLIYNTSDRMPRKLDDLDGTLGVVPGGSAEQILISLQKHYPAIQWNRAESDADTESLLSQVSEGTLDYTVADSNQFAVEQRYFPELRAAFAVSEPQDLAWALKPGADDSLYQAAQQYLRSLTPQSLESLHDRYFGTVGQAGTYSVSRFNEDIVDRLPQYEHAFRTAADSLGLDWRVLAAVGYQESHWNPGAVSPTGVRGMMMLTTVTAYDMSLDRQDTRQSILGAAIYLQQMMAQLPATISEPDRTWMALAAYNVGIGHLLDARALVAKHGGDPNRWLEVREALPLLTREEWFKQTQHGYARGYEAVGFVAAVRNYYDILSWQTSGKHTAANPLRSAEANATLTTVNPAATITAH